MEDVHDNFGAVSLGEELRERREALGMAVGDVARAAHVSIEFVQALEENAYHRFPARVYAQGALRRLSHVFGGQDGEVLVALLNREWPQDGDGYAHGMQAPASGRRQVHRLFSDFRLTPQKTGMLFAAISVLGILGFLGLRLSVFTLPPRLVVESPMPYSRIGAPAAIIKGTTEKESRLTVNGREIRIDERGMFLEPMELPLGTNRLEFISESKFGKMSRKVRYVLVE